MKITNEQNLPSPMVDGVKRDRELYTKSYGGRVADISATGLIGPPQIRILNKLHKDEIVEDISNMLWAFFGSAVGAYLDFAKTSGIAEHRMYYTDMDLNMTVAGQFDFLENKILDDYKLTSVWAVMDGVKPEWEKQLNIYDFLCSHDDLEVEKLRIIVMFRDWSATKAKFDRNYPQHQIITLPVKKWDRAEQERYIKERMILHREAEKGNVPPCTDEERWASQAKFAVMKEGRKSAVRLLDTQEAAEKYIADKGLDKKHSVVERPKVYKRCEDYCSVSQFCKQFNRGE